VVGVAARRRNGAARAALCAEITNDDNPGATGLPRTGAAPLAATTATTASIPATPTSVLI